LTPPATTEQVLLVADQKGIFVLGAQVQGSVIHVYLGDEDITQKIKVEKFKVTVDVPTKTPGV
jgi:hypothetical protein